MKSQSRIVTLSSKAANKPAISGAELVDAMSAAVLVLDDTGTILYSNLAAETLLSVSSNVLEGKALADVLQLNDAWTKLLEKPRGAVGYELPLQLQKAAKPSAKINLHINRCELTGVKGACQLLMLLPCDANDKLGEQALQKHAMHSASVMSEILAHEVRNPLSGIRGAAQLLEQGVSEEDRTLVDLIRTEVDRIGNLLNQVEYFSCSNPIVTAPLNIHEVLRYVAILAKQGFAAQMTLEERYDPSLPLVDGNRELLIQALLNLVKNAAEALKDVASPSITLRTTYRSGYRVQNSRNESIALPICIQVQDNGAGIPATMREHMFDAFVTDKPSGKGLGLPIVAKIAADHYGAIQLEDTEPGLTTFSLMLPQLKK